MRLTNKYNLTPPVDFEDVELDTDNLKFIDPFLINIDKSDFASECCNAIISYFGRLLEYAINNQKAEGYNETQFITERNETRLGYSLGEPKGKSGGAAMGRELFDLIINSAAVKTGMVGDIFDSSIMIEGLGCDKLSDFITNIIFEKLVEYTQHQCNKYGIPLERTNIRKPYWSCNQQKWLKKAEILLPIHDGLPILFVPVRFLEKSLIYDYERFYNKGMIPYYCRMAIADPTSGLVRILKSGIRKPIIKSIKKAYPLSKEDVINFIKSHSDVYKEYKEKQLKYINYKNYK